ncbi:hypothetical protein HZS_6529 [Henneguya salminicola]|nr:hypothetical protein HZS_6529 [Henneguya salminicola]
MTTISNKLKDRNIKIITVGVGYGIDEEELKGISSAPENFISAKSFDDLLDILTTIFTTFEKFSSESLKGNTQSEKGKDGDLILNNSEYLKSNSNSYGKDSNQTEQRVNLDDKGYPYMNPIIVNIHTCPHSKIHHVGCKPGNSRCFQSERNFILNPTKLEEELCRCSDLALRHNLNYFKIDDNGACTIGTANAEECERKRYILSRNRCIKKSDAIYVSNNI